MLQAGPLLAAHLRWIRSWLAMMALVLTSLIATSAQGTGITDGNRAKPTPTPAIAPNVKRWFDIDALSLATRYRIIRAANDVVTTNQEQYQVVARARFKFDSHGRYSITGGLFSGNTLTTSWNNTGLGTGKSQSNLYLKQLYFDASPLKSWRYRWADLA